MLKKSKSVGTIHQYQLAQACLLQLLPTKGRIILFIKNWVMRNRKRAKTIVFDVSTNENTREVRATPFTITTGIKLEGA